VTKKKYIISVGEDELWDILRQGIPHEVLFRDEEWETNHKGLDNLKGAVLISAFHGSDHWKLFFRTPEGKVLRVILPAEYFGRPFEISVWG